MTTLLILAVAFLFTVGTPVAFGLGIATLLYFLAKGIPPIVLAQRMVYGIYSFPFLAIPFFLLAGRLLTQGGATERIFRFAGCLMRHVRGGLAHVTIVAEMILSGMSGSALADAAALGMVNIDAMVKDGFDLDFSAAVTGAAAALGPIIPPSIAFVVYGSVTGVSTGKLLIGGILPGLVMGILMMILTYFIAVRRKYPARARATWSELWQSFRGCFFALLAPIIIVGGILTGVFTPTEAAAVAAVYALFLGFIYKDLTIKDLPRIFFESVLDTAALTFIVSASMAFGWAVTIERLPHLMGDILTGFTTNPLILLFTINIVLLILGCLMEMTPILIIVPPILLPTLLKLGVDPVHFGVILVLNITIGLLTPPFGLAMFILMGITKLSMGAFSKAVLPYLFLLIGFLFLMSYWPELVVWLPRLMMD
jgi:tripartite ATP-independent transporter DctM subunit